MISGNLWLKISALVYRESGLTSLQEPQLWIGFGLWFVEARTMAWVNCLLVRNAFLFIILGIFNVRNYV
jgi:hypothetical protein